MSKARTVVPALLGAGLAACIAVPRQLPDDDRCRLVTHSYTLTVASLGDTRISCSGDARGCLVVASIIPAASLVVSGSIVVVGDTVHWIEREGRCSDSATQRAVATLVDASRTAGGKVLSTAGDAMQWLRHTGGS